MNRTILGRRAPRARHDGVLLLDKPRGLSSNAALMRARRVFGGAKAGHGGTLDPMATGLLPLLFGEATKFAHGLLEADKTYCADLILGVRTETGDSEGRVLEDRRPLAASIDRAAIDEVLGRFVGDIDQVPPMYSALKRDGKPLYAYAREGVTLERAARRVRIDAIERLGLEGERLVLRVQCSKGTYIRTLAEDIGEALGCGAHLGALRRERVGALRIEDAIALDALETLDVAGALAWLAPVDALLGEFPRIDLDSVLAERFAHGQRIRIAAPAGAAGTAVGTPVRVYDAQGRLLGIADALDGLLCPRRLVATDPPASGRAFDASRDAPVPPPPTQTSSRNPPQ